MSAGAAGGNFFFAADFRVGFFGIVDLIVRRRAWKAFYCGAPLLSRIAHGLREGFPQAH
jgi:hypothetical protein